MAGETYLTVSTVPICMTSNAYNVNSYTFWCEDGGKVLAHGTGYR